MKLSIVIINYNTQKLTEACLRSIKAHLDVKDYEVIVIDNASDKFDTGAIKKIFPPTKIIHSKTNLGFAKANNLAAKQAKGEYLWFLNSDTKLTSDSKISKLLDFLEMNDRYATASPLVVDKSGAPQAYQFGYWPAVWRMLLDKPAKARVAKDPSRSRHYKWLMADFLSLKSRDVDWVSGAAMMVRKSVFDMVGGFTAEYFLYYEDIDLCRKFWANSYKVRFIKESTIVHFEGGSSSNIAEKKRIAYESQDIYFKRWGSPVSRFFLKNIRRPYAKKWQAKD